MIARRYLIMFWIVTAATIPCAGNEREHAAGMVAVDGEPMNIPAMFPLDTETIIFAKGPFAFQATAFEHGREEDESDFLAGLQHVPISILLSLRDGAYAELLDGAHVAMAVAGARRFRAPKGVGMAVCECCQVLRLAEAKVTDEAQLDRLMERIRDDAGHQRRVRDHDVFVVSETYEQERVQILVVRLSRREVVFATNHRFLEDVLTRLDVLKQGGKREHEALACFPGWKRIPADAPFWAVRRYDVGAAADDPSSAIGLHESAFVRDRSAIGVTASYMSGEAARMSLHYLTSAPRGDVAAADLWAACGFAQRRQELAPIMQQVESGVIRLEADLNQIGSRKLRDRWARGVVSLMGHLPSP